MTAIGKGRSYIGESVVRPQTKRLLAGRGVFTDDVTLPRMLHVAFVRSPHAHARIVSMDVAPARAVPGVIAVVTGEDIAPVCSGWVGTLAGLKNIHQFKVQVLPPGVAPQGNVIPMQPRQPTALPSPIEPGNSASTAAGLNALGGESGDAY